MKGLNYVKCPNCGGTQFLGNQVIYTDVICSSANGSIFFDGNPGDEIQVKEANTPYGPFVCTSCGTEYESLEEGMVANGKTPVYWFDILREFKPAYLVNPVVTEGSPPPVPSEEDMRKWRNDDYEVEVKVSEAMKDEIPVETWIIVRKLNNRMPDILVSNQEINGRFLPRSVSVKPAVNHPIYDSCYQMTARDAALVAEEFKKAAKAAEAIWREFIVPILENPAYVGDWKYQ